MKQNTLPFPFYFYGSADSTDVDVIVSVPPSVMPQKQEDRKVLIKQLIDAAGLNWNASLVVIEDGKIIDTIYPKSWIDSLNNAVYTTYELHHQVFPNPIYRLVKRNKLLAIYKAARTVLSACTRTSYRPMIRPIINGIHDFSCKLDALRKLNWLNIDSFGQKNARDIDLWKTIAFYIGQNISLLQDDIEIYTKKKLIYHHPNLKPFIDRTELNEENKIYLNTVTQLWLDEVERYGTFQCKDGIMWCKDEVIDMKNEKY